MSAEEREKRDLSRNFFEGAVQLVPRRLPGQQRRRTSSTSKRVPRPQAGEAEAKHRRRRKHHDSDRELPAGAILE